jgi:hypothetical protein
MVNERIKEIKMATKKAKTTESKPKKSKVKMDMPGTMGSAKIVLPKEKKTKSKNVPSGGWPKISQGTHLTVKTFEDGKTELIWDDEQLLKEVREAIAGAELNQMKPAVKAKVATRKKKAIT